MQFFYTILLISLMGIWGKQSSYAHNQIITAIQDNGCSSHQELAPTVNRIDNYNLNSLKGNE